jgi:hypothetical protein
MRAIGAVRPSYSRRGGEVVGDVRAGRWLGSFMNSTYTSHRHLHESQCAYLHARFVDTYALRCCRGVSRYPMPQVLLSMPKQTSPDGKQSFSRSARERGACKARFEEERD